MLVFHSHCQMANQMFMYACALSLSKKKGAWYCLSRLNDLKYFKLSKADYLFNTLKYALFRLSNKLFSHYQWHHYQDNFLDYSNQMLVNSQNSWYYGYFQNENYFASHSNVIKKRFEIKQPFRAKYEQFNACLEQNKIKVVVHIRRRDYKNFNLPEINGPDLCLPTSYYMHCLQPFIDKDTYQIIFISDEIREVEREFSWIKNSIFSKNSAIVDFQILQHGHYLILANSSFSWWGAWLNTNNPTIFVPKYFLGFKVKNEFPIGIIPQNWTQVEV